MRITCHPKSAKPRFLSVFTCDSVVGPVTWALDGDNACYVGVGSMQNVLPKIQKFFPSAKLSVNENTDLERYSEDVDQFISDGTSPDRQFVLYGTDFQLTVWRALIDLGRNLCAYSELAASVGRPKAVRAVGTAVGTNPISLFIPCHHILPKSGGTGNYGWGPDVKKSILRAEKLFA